jgi:hypothetical protein
MAVETVAGFDWLMSNPDFFAGPYPVYQRLRTEQPLFWSESWSSWQFTRYSDVHSCLRAHGAFSSVGIQVSLLRRIPRIELAAKEVDFRPNIAFWRLLSLPVVISTVGRGVMPM